MLRGKRIDEELDFSDSILVTYQATCIFSKAGLDPDIFDSLTCDIKFSPIFDKDTLVAFQHDKYGNEIRVLRKESNTILAMLYFLK